MQCQQLMQHQTAKSFALCWGQPVMKHLHEQTTHSNKRQHIPWVPSRTTNKLPQLKIHCYNRRLISNIQVQFHLHKI